MSFSLMDARFKLLRALGLTRRGLTSLRSRGMRATWQRVAAQLNLFAPAVTHTLLAGDLSPFQPFALPVSCTPEVTIVIPVHGHVEQTIACLRAIAMHPPATPFEVVVIDDASLDATPEVLQRIGGLRARSLPVNSGFIAACTVGAELARGRFLLFLNNDTVPQPGWMDAMRNSFVVHAGVGIVGAQLLYPDGRLQESGAMLLRDGRGESRGRFADADHPQFNYCADVDYVSGAALMIPLALFEQLGGFDPRYAPGYYEDTDLAFRVREAGLRVLVQPVARVVHVEGASSGTDPTRGMKAAQARNRIVFASLWRAALDARPVDPVSAGRLPRVGTREVLIVDNVTPAPTRDSASLRLVNLMRLLREAGIHVVFLPADRRHAGGDTRLLQAQGIEVWHAPHAASMTRWMQAHGHRFTHVVLCRHYVARELLPMVRRHAPEATVVFDSIDLHYMRELRGAEIVGDSAMRRDALGTKARELDVIARSDVTLVVSPVEAQLLARDAPGAMVRVLSNLHEISGPGLPFAERRDLVFVGGFRHPPNVDAVLWFVREVLPAIRARRPDIHFHSVGGDVPEAIASLARLEGVTIHGHVPDITPFMDGCRIALAPLRFGAGVKGKVNLSMAHGQPVVATPCAAEGMQLRDGEDVLLAATPEAFCNAVLHLYENERLWSRLAAGGLENVSRHFSLDAGRAAVQRVFVESGPAPPLSPG